MAEKQYHPAPHPDHRHHMSSSIVNPDLSSRPYKGSKTFQNMIEKAEKGMEENQFRG